MVMTGRNANKGPVFSTPNKLPKKPSCITSVVNPSVANTKPSTAFNGIGLNGIQILVAQMLRVQ